MLVKDYHKNIVYSLSAKHSIQCLDVHRWLQMPTTMEDPLTFLLNLLSTRESCSCNLFPLGFSTSQLYVWLFWAWPPSSLKIATLASTLFQNTILGRLCSIIHELAFLWHDKVPVLSLNLGQWFFDWIPWL